jgi:hypothetical protein
LFDGVQSTVGVSAALPRFKLEEEPAERSVVAVRKERMNFMSSVSVVVFVAGAFLFALRLA